MQIKGPVSGISILGQTSKKIDLVLQGAHTQGQLVDNGTQKIHAEMHFSKSLQGFTFERGQAALQNRKRPLLRIPLHLQVVDLIRQKGKLVPKRVTHATQEMAQAVSIRWETHPLQLAELRLLDRGVRSQSYKPRALTGASMQDKIFGPLALEPKLPRTNQ